MARKVFYSFHYDDDAHRVQLVKNMGAVEGQPILTSKRMGEGRKGREKRDRKMDRREDVGKVMRGRACRAPHGRAQMGRS